MSDPNYSFSGFQALSPNKPLPAAELDAELIAIHRLLDKVSSQIAQVWRSDGGIANGVVTLDSLAPNVKEALEGGGGSGGPVGPNGVGFADLADELIAGPAAAAAATAGDRLMVPAAVRVTIDALRPFATRIEAEGGSAAGVVLSPARGRDMLDALRAFATEEDAEEAVREDAVLSPATGARQIGALRPVASAGPTLTWGPIAAGASESQTITVPGAGVGDRVIWSLPPAGIAPGLVVTAWVSAASTVTFRITNVTGGSLTPFGGAATSLNISALGF